MTRLPKLTSAQSVYLDCLRMLAAMAVLFGHAADMFLRDSLLYTAKIQTAGVLVFFLMSGFLISYSVFRRYDDPAYGFREYFIDRFCRIYCAFIPALIFVWLIDMQTLKLPSFVIPDLADFDGIREMAVNYSLTNWLGNLFMLQDFPLFQVARHAGIDSNLFVTQFGSATPFWTISIEWWIYMAFGILAVYYLKERKPFKLWHIPVFGFAFITPVYYLVGGAIDFLSFLWIFGMGACLLFLYFPQWYAKNQILKRTINTRWVSLFVFFVSCILMAVRLLALIFDNNGLSGKGFAELQFSVFLTIAILSLLVFFGTIERVPYVIEKFCNFVAGYSYSLYLIHVPILTYLYFSNGGDYNNPSLFWTGIVVSNGVAIAFWWAFERHYHKLAKWIKTKGPARRASLQA